MKIGKIKIDKRKAIIGTAFGISVFLGFAALYIDKKISNKRNKEKGKSEPTEKPTANKPARRRHKGHDRAQFEKLL